MAEPILFRPFCPRSPFTITSGKNLPHWRQEGCTYFITFRTADSLPKAAIAKIKRQREEWLESENASADSLTSEQQREYARQLSRLTEPELDKGFGECVLRRTQTREIVEDALGFFDRNRIHLGDFAIMPNHVHALITPRDSFDLTEILRSIKSFSANKINAQLGSTGNFWHSDSYDHIVRNSEQLLAFQKYILNNPSKASLAKNQFTFREATFTVQE